MPWLADARPPVFDTTGFQPVRPAISLRHRVPEHLVVSFEALHVIGRLNQESKQIQENGEYLVCGLRMSRYGPVSSPGSLPALLHFL